MINIFKFLIIFNLLFFSKITSSKSVLDVISNNQDLMLEPKDLGFNVIDSVKLSGGKNIKESSKIFLDILKNKGTSEQVDAVLANSGLAIYCAKKLNSIKDGIEIARESLESGKAYNCLKLFIENK